MNTKNTKSTDILLQQYKAHTKQLQQQIYMLKNQLAIKDEQAQRTKESMEHVFELVNDKQQQLHRKVKEMELQRDNQQQLLNYYQDEISSLEKAVNDQQLENAVLKSEVQILENREPIRPVKPDPRQKDLQDKLQHMEAERIRLEESCEFYKTQYESTNKKLISLMQELERFHQEPPKQQIPDLTEFDQILLKHQADLRSANQRNTLLQRKLDQALTDKSELEKRIVTLENDRRKIMEKFQASVQRPKPGLDQNRRLAEMEQRLEMYASEIRRLQLQLESAQQQLQEAKEQAESSSSLYHKLKFQQKLDQDDKKLLTNINEILTSKLMSLEDELRTYKSSSPYTKPSVFQETSRIQSSTPPPRNSMLKGKEGSQSFTSFVRNLALNCNRPVFTTSDEDNQSENRSDVSFTSLHSVDVKKTERKSYNMPFRYIVNS